MTPRAGASADPTQGLGGDRDATKPPDGVTQRHGDGADPTRHYETLTLVSGHPAAAPDLSAAAAPKPHTPTDPLSAAFRAFADTAAAQIQKTDHQGVELTLAPEELGRIRMTMAGDGGHMTVIVHADRAETLDLLRRNIDMLAQDFRDLGYAQTSFSFDGGGADPPPLPPHPSRGPADPIGFGPTFRQPAPGVPAEGLDLRL